jgi:hypothetical protein
MQDANHVLNFGTGVANKLIKKGKLFSSTT